MSDWKTGDVAMTAHHTVALCHKGGQMIDSDGAPWSDETFPENLRPLVVIDPESAEDVKRLAECMMLSGCRSTVDLAAALREFAAPTPPRPDEPQGLGAVVEDVDGERWVLSRDAHPGLFRVRWENPQTLAYRTYAGIDAVRVLSEGVSNE